MVESSTEQLLDLAHNLTKETIDVLTEKWNAMFSVTPEFLTKRHEKFLEYLKDLYDDIILSEENARIGLLHTIEEKLKEFRKLKKDLHLHETAIPWETVKEPYSVFLEEINASMREYEEMRDKMLAKLNSLRSKEKELCDELEISPLDEFPHLIPSSQELEDLEMHIFSMREEKISRTQFFKEARSRIIHLMKAMEMEVENGFEFEVMSADEDSFIPATSKIEQLKNLLGRMEKEYEDKVEYRSMLVDKLKKLWDQLKIDPCERSSFLSKFPDVTKSHLKALNEEISRCEEIKKANMKPIVANLREQISNLWDILTFGDEQKAQFKAFNTDLINEDILDLHELEVDRLNLYLKKYQHIYDLADERDKLWKRMLHLDEISKDKSRLFNNRGGQLLKEERERKSLEINVPKVDKKLKNALLEYESEEGSPFLWHGQNLLRKITAEWNERLDAKDTKKNGKKADDLSSNAPASGAKRKMLTPGSETDPKMRRVHDFGNQTVTLKGGMRTPKRLPVVRTPRRIKTPLNVSTASIASYSHFQDGLELLEASGATTPKSVLKETTNRLVSMACSSPSVVAPSGRQLTPASAGVSHRVTAHPSRQRLEF